MKNSTITIAYATETGNAESLAEDTVKHLKKSGFQTQLIELGDASLDDFSSMDLFLGIVSTWGDGDPPSDAEDFFTELKDSAPKGWSQLSFSVLGLGDTGYDFFCQCGKDLDSELERHGANRLLPRVDCDIDFEEPFEEWLDALTKALESRVAVSV